MKSTDIIPLVVYSAPLVGLLVLSLLKPNTARIGYALLFVLVGCGINYTVSFVYPDNMQAWSEVALLPFYRNIMGTWLAPLGGFFFFATATYQLAVALLLLSRGKWVKLGVVGGMLFFLSITPIMVMTFPSIIGAAGLAFLLTRAYDHSGFDMLRVRKLTILPHRHEGGRA
jgi:hypothetical protein